MTPHPTPHAGLADLLRAVLADALDRLQRDTGTVLGSVDRRHCLRAVDGLWRRRDGLLRALVMPARKPAPAGAAVRPMKLWTLVDDTTIELEMSTADAARALLDATEVEWRELQLESAPGAPTPAWPPAPARCAAGLRWIVERASADHAVRRALLRLGTELLAPRLVALYRQQLEGGPAEDVAPAPAPAAAPRAAPTAMPAAAPVAPPAAAVPPPAEQLIDAAQPGQWFRIVLHDQWAAARVTWRSRNGHYFMFSSRLAGRSHSLSRAALERLIAAGRFERLVPGSAAPAGR